MTALSESRQREDVIQINNIFLFQQNQTRSHYLKYHRENSRQTHQANLFLIDQRINVLPCQFY